MNKIINNDELLNLLKNKLKSKLKENNYLEKKLEKIEKLSDELEKIKLSIKNDKPINYNIKTIKNKVPIQDKLNKYLSEEEIINIIKESLKICNCGNKYLIYKCDICNPVIYETNNLLWNKIDNYCIKQQITQCNFCLRNKSSGIRFHFDHINIFNKRESICKMVEDNYSLDDIITEIKKCQLLCVDCHSIVTKIEHIYGFIQIKINKTNYDNIIELYDENMTFVYSVLKKKY
jgi:hypothetical protein